MHELPLLGVSAINEGLSGWSFVDWFVHCSQESLANDTPVIYAVLLRIAETGGKARDPEHQIW